MSVPSLQPISHTQYCVSGDVTIHPTATIAAGVLLQADPDSKVIVGAGVCLGMGTVLHAHQGTLEIEAEATIGTSVLIVGSCKIGASACIGSASTIWHHSIDRGTVIPPLSLLGTGDRPVAAPIAETEAAPSLESAPSPEPTVSLVVPQGSLNGALNSANSAVAHPAASQPTAEIQLSFSTPVYGQASLNRLLSTLMPHRHSVTRGEDNGDTGGTED